MAFWLFMLCCDLLVPLTMLVCGRLFRKTPPKTINGAFGYRTKMSMKNEDTWRFAHAHCGKVWTTAGGVLLPLSALAMLPVYGRDTRTAGMWGGALCMVQCVVLLVSIIPTERALRAAFDDKGNRRAPAADR